MTVSVDVWLRGTEHATTKTIDGLSREPSAWTDEDVRFVLEGMLRVMAQLKQPGEEPRTIALPVAVDPAFGHQRLEHGVFGHAAP